MYGAKIACSRVISGTIVTAQKVRSQGPHYIPGSNEDLNIKSIQRTERMMSRATEQIANLLGGNTLVLVSVGLLLLKSGFFITFDDVHNIADMKLTVTRLAGTGRGSLDPLVVGTTEENGNTGSMVVASLT